MIDLKSIDTWPVCTKVNRKSNLTCNTPFVIRQAIDWVTGEAVWAWFRDCKCRSGPTVLCDAEGPLEPDPDRPGNYLLRTAPASLNLEPSCVEVDRDVEAVSYDRRLNDG